MNHDANELLELICDRIRAVIDPGRVAVARRRQAEVMAGREPDYLTLDYVRSGALGPEDDWPDFDWAEQWHDPA